MKKVILLLLLILPVIIVAASFAIAGAIGRGIMYVEIERVYISDLDGFTMAGYIDDPYAENTYKLYAQVGGVYELEAFLAIEPERAKFSDLEFSYSNPSAAAVADGKIRVAENRRTSDKDGVVVKVKYGLDTFLTIYLDIAPDYSSFDYFGCDYNALSEGISNHNPQNPDEKWSKYCSVNTGSGYLVINRENAGAAEIPIGDILRNGFDTAPYDILYKEPYRTDFLKSLNFTSGNGDKLKIVNKGPGGNGVNVFNAEVSGAGVVEVRITADWTDVLRETVVNVEIV